MLRNWVRKGSQGRVSGGCSFHLGSARQEREHGEGIPRWEEFLESVLLPSPMSNPVPPTKNAVWVVAVSGIWNRAGVRSDTSSDTPWLLDLGGGNRLFKPRYCHLENGANIYPLGFS